MADSDAPEVQEDFDIKVRMADDASDGEAQAYLSALAEKINESDFVSIEADPAEPVSHDADGTWAKGTMAVIPSLGCGSKKVDPDYDDDSST
jgi:hypothetical protein